MVLPGSDLPSLVCTCKESAPMINLGDVDHRWWVHIICGRPDEYWLRSLGDTMLNFFRGGPIDGYAYPTSTLFRRQDLMAGYRWVPKVIISKKNDDTARVWLHESLPDDAVIVVDQDRHDLLTIEQEDRRMPTIERRRKDLKLSREALGDLTGLTHAQIQRIEQDGPRTTDDERRRVNDVLDRLEDARSVNP